ncbi:MAG: anti-sigma B factor antagonist [Thermoproteota archaeon]|jgi:anti-sigma B factor antagonist
MTMKSNIMRDASGNIIIKMEGQIEYEFSIPFRQQLSHLCKDNPTADITVDLGKVDFVGSSGICHFVETLKIINNKKIDRVALSNVKSEFLKVFKLYNLHETDILMDHFDMKDDETVTLNTLHGNRKRTFEN